MNKRIKLIWDFRGPDANAIAEHHAKHLSQYVALEALDKNITGHQQFSGNHSIAYIVVDESRMIQVRDDLRPHRGELYGGEQ